MSELEDFEKLKDKIGSLRQHADQAQGALNEIMRQLKSKFKCKTLEQAEKKLRKIKREEAETSKIFKARLKNFKRKHRNALK